LRAQNERRVIDEARALVVHAYERGARDKCGEGNAVACWVYNIVDSTRPAAALVRDIIALNAKRQRYGVNVNGALYADVVGDSYARVVVDNRQNVLRKRRDVAGHEDAAIGQKDGVVEGVVKTCGGVAVAVDFDGDFVLVVAE